MLNHDSKIILPRIKYFISHMEYVNIFIITHIKESNSIVISIIIVVQILKVKNIRTINTKKIVKDK
jgi:hypothetical protein